MVQPEQRRHSFPPWSSWRKVDRVPSQPIETAPFHARWVPADGGDAKTSAKWLIYPPRNIPVLHQRAAAVRPGQRAGGEVR